MKLSLPWGAQTVGAIAMWFLFHGQCPLQCSEPCPAQSILPLLWHPAPLLQKKCPELSLVNGNNVGFGSNTGFASNFNAYHYVLIEPD